MENITEKRYFTAKGEYIGRSTAKERSSLTRAKRKVKTKKRFSKARKNARISTKHARRNYRATKKAAKKRYRKINRQVKQNPRIQRLKKDRDYHRMKGNVHRAVGGDLIGGVYNIASGHNARENMAAHKYRGEYRKLRRRKLYGKKK